MVLGMRLQVSTSDLKYLFKNNKILELLLVTHFKYPGSLTLSLYFCHLQILPNYFQCTGNKQR